MEGGTKVSLCHFLADQKIAEFVEENVFWGIVTCRGKRLSLLFDVVVLLLITTGTPHSHIRACGPSAITLGMLALMHSG